MEAPPGTRCLGLDPGIRNLGWAVVETVGEENPRVLSSGNLDCGRRHHASRLVMATVSDCCAKLASQHGRTLQAVAVEEQA